MLTILLRFFIVFLLLLNNGYSTSLDKYFPPGSKANLIVISGVSTCAVNNKIPLYLKFKTLTPLQGVPYSVSACRMFAYALGTLNCKAFIVYPEKLVCKFQSGKVIQNTIKGVFSLGNDALISSLKKGAELDFYIENIGKSNSFKNNINKYKSRKNNSPISNKDASAIIDSLFNKYSRPSEPENLVSDPMKSYLDRTDIK